MSAAAWILISLALLFALAFGFSVDPRAVRARLRGARPGADLDAPLPPGAYRRWNDVPLPGTPARISRVLVSRCGIFLIEENTAGGEITGHPEQAKWTCSDNGERHSFWNPLLILDQHAQRLADHLALPAASVRPIALFTGNPVFRSPVPENVCTPANLNAYIRSRSGTCLSAEEVEAANRAIQELCTSVRA